MPHDWVKSALRLMNAMAGKVKKLDRVPYFALINEQMLCRVAGVTVKEMLSSPEIYAKAVIGSYEFLEVDTIQIPTSYAGPGEALAFAESNDKIDTIRWYDYKPLSIIQGAVCKTEEDIDKLEIPDHSKSPIWKVSTEAANIVNEKTKFPQMFGLGIWSVVQELRGVQAFKDMRKNPELLLKLCEKVYESQLDVIKFWTENVGFSPMIMLTGYSFNKHMMSFDDAMKFEGQFIKRLQEKTKVPFIFHNCGTSPYFTEVCKEIDFVAVHGSHPLDLDYWIKFKEMYPEITIMGANIDVSREMLTGTSQDVEEKVRDNIIALAPEGRYVCAPVCCLPWGVPLGNIMAIPKAIEKYGQYPIQFE